MPQTPAKGKPSLRRTATATALALAGAAMLTPRAGISQSPPACAISDRVCWRRMHPPGAELPWVAFEARSRTLAYVAGAGVVPDVLAAPETPVLHLPARRGRPALQLRLGQLVTAPAGLPRADAGHRRWARSYGAEGPRRFVLVTIEGRRLVFDPIDVRLVSGVLLGAPHGG